MSDIGIIYQKCKAAYYKGWAEEDVEECKKLIPSLSLEEQRMLNHSRWMSKKNPLYPTLFACLYQDELSVVLEKLNSMSNKELLDELSSTRSSFKKERIPQILCDRYETMADDERKDVFSLLIKKGLKSKEDK